MVALVLMQVLRCGHRRHACSRVQHTFQSTICMPDGVGHCFDADAGAVLQAKKVRRVQSAFELFNRMMQTPGKAELTLTELRVSSRHV